jgi:hypothetical protein
MLQVIKVFLLLFIHKKKVLLRFRRFQTTSESFVSEDDSGFRGAQARVPQKIAL